MSRLTIMDGMIRALYNEPPTICADLTILLVHYALSQSAPGVGAETIRATIHGAIDDMWNDAVRIHEAAK